MANIVVSSLCNLSCAFCFARDHLSKQTNPENQPFISLEDFKDRLDFLERSAIEEVRLIGGEPTLHPEFLELVKTARGRFKKLMLFTHGLLPDSVLHILESIPPDEITILVNTNAYWEAAKHKQKEKNGWKTGLTRLAERVTLGYTIASVDFDCDDLIPLLLETGAKKSIRLGLAQPVLGGQNSYLFPRQYPFIGKKVAEFVSRAAAYEIDVEFDCGFVRCMFSPEALEMVTRRAQTTIFRCNPVLDIDLHGQSSHCFPLADRFTESLTPTSLAADLRAAIHEQIRPYRLAGIYKECSSCKFKQTRECTGGCLALTLSSFQNTDFHTTVSRERKIERNGLSDYPHS